MSKARLWHYGGVEKPELILESKPRDSFDPSFLAPVRSMVPF